MASLYIFCSLTELNSWIGSMCKKWSLGVLTFSTSAQHGIWEEDGSTPQIREETFRAFALPRTDAPQQRLTINDTKPRDWGWVDIRPGGVRQRDSQRILLMSEIHGEDFREEYVHPARFVQWLKRDLKKKSAFNEGVIGRNPSIDGFAKYRHISYSPEGQKLFESGTLWKQRPDDNVIFEPDA